MYQINHDEVLQNSVLEFYHILYFGRFEGKTFLKEKPIYGLFCSMSGVKSQKMRWS